ncbi:hypothetical protein ID866_12181 [Astraeus odoratus]|nr:hypothetical protein ID866_12181 [Astraeus odoratus]
MIRPYVRGILPIRSRASPRDVKVPERRGGGRLGGRSGLREAARAQRVIRAHMRGRYRGTCGRSGRLRCWY